MRKRRKKTGQAAFVTPANILIGILSLIFFISLGLIVAINFRPLYYADIKWLNLEQASGLNADVIRLNYDALIDYCSPFHFGTLSFPSLAASESGISHFAEVKVIFNFFFIAGIVSLVLLLILFSLKKKKDDHQFLLTSSITTVALPLILGIACLINFELIFELFHKIAFRNNDWLFDPITDPIILVLPETFFMQCAFIIIGFVLLGSLAQFLFYLHYKRSRKEEPLMKPKVNYFY